MESKTPDQWSNAFWAVWLSGPAVWLSGPREARAKLSSFFAAAMDQARREVLREISLEKTRDVALEEAARIAESLKKDSVDYWAGGQAAAIMIRSLKAVR